MKLHLDDAEATAALGAALGRVFENRAGGVVYLRGDLGSGKTTLSRGLLRALGVRGAIRSPTYTLMEPYRTGGPEVLHLDLYRLQDARELLNLGLDDYPPDRTLWLVEWPERAGALLPPADVTVRLCAQAAGREADIQWAQDVSPPATETWPWPQNSP